MGNYQISLRVEGINKPYISSFPAIAIKEDLDVLLKILNSMRQRLQGAAKPAEVVDVMRERLDDADGNENGRNLKNGT